VFHVVAKAPQILAALQNFCRVGAEQVASKGVKLAPITTTKVRYQRERFGTGVPRIEDWQRPLALLARGRGDCEDIACYEVVRLRQLGIPADPALETAGKSFHVVVQLPGGAIYDPCPALGMR
jgi:hypothetical protein